MENTRKRTRSPSPPPWRRDQHQRPRGGGGGGGDHSSGDRKSTHNQREQTRLNALQEAEQARAWVSKEDTFVLHQMKKKAEIRVKEGRAKPIDFLAVNLRVIDPQQENPLEDEIPDEDLDIVDPEGILDGLDEEELEELEGEIETYIQLETNKTNGEFWRTMKILCVDRLSKVHPDSTRAVSSVASDVDQLLSKKTLPELQSLEGQIERKLSSNEIIDPDYWNALLRSLRIWKAKASLRQVYGQVIKQRVEILQKQQREEALSVQKKLEQILSGDSESDAAPTSYHSPRPIPYTRLMDPEPLLKLPYNDKSLPTVSEHSFLSTIGAERHKILKLGYVPHKPRAGATNTVVASSSTSKPAASSSSSSALAMAPPSNPTSRFAAVFNDDFSSATTALYEREVARGISENEEIFTAEESLHPPTPLWADKYRPRKPRYFNRVQMGYEWNKYNQTHYDHDNPPPKVVQGYKFNIFYPDLIDKSKAPTYRIEREGGRKRGQSFAPAGEEDTCLIRFIAGPPYEDIAFRIVDKEWDYSAKRERGFRSSFEKGILQLHFQLKKIYYRK